MGTEDNLEKLIFMTASYLNIFYGLTDKGTLLFLHQRTYMQCKGPRQSHGVWEQP